MPVSLLYSKVAQFHTYTRSFFLMFFFIVIYPRRFDMVPSAIHFPGDSEVKVPVCNVGDLGSIPVWGRSPGEGNGNPLQYSCLENPMDRGAWWATVHGVTKSRTRLSDFTFFHFPVLYSRTLLVVHPVCNSLPLPTPNSQSIPLLPLSPLATPKSDLCVHES